MKTIYYFASMGNDSPMVIAVNGSKGYAINPTPQGKDVTTGVSLFDGDVIENLRAAYQQMASDGELYAMEDISNDFAEQNPDNFFEFKEDDFENLTELVALEMDFKTIRERSGMNMTDFGKYFNIPFRTVQSWERGERKCPDYLLDLMVYKLKSEKVGKYGKEH